MFWRLGTMLKRFFIAKSFRLYISKQNKIPGIIFFCISKVRKSSRRWLLGRQNCILSQKSVPQGPSGRIKLYFEPESRPAGAFWAKYWISCESKVACKFSKRNPRRVLIMFWWARTIDLDALILLVFLLLKKVLSALSYGHFTATKEFWSQCHILPVLMAFFNGKFAGGIRCSWGSLCAPFENEHPEGDGGITQGGTRSGAFIYWVGTL